MKTKIAFYKAKGNYIDKAIRIWKVSPYSYCEIVRILIYIVIVQEII